MNLRSNERPRLRSAPRAERCGLDPGYGIIAGSRPRPLDITPRADRVVRHAFPGFETKGALLVHRTRSRLLSALAAAIIFLAPLGLAAPASAAFPDGHNCWWVSPDNPPSKTNDITVNYTKLVQCDGPVRRIELTVELLYYGLVLGTGSGQTIRGATDVWQNTTLIPLWGFGVTNPGEYCDSGYYSGRATATVQYLSGIPEFITRTIETPPVSISCPPPPIPTNPPSGTVTVTNPGTQSMELRDTVALQMQATGGTGSYVWSATGLPTAW